MTGSGPWGPERRALTGGLVLTVTLVACEALAVVTILPVVVDELGGLRLYGWVTSAFFLGSVVGIVVAGQHADRRGPARPFALGVALFAAGLATGGLAPSMAVLVGGRALQGLGAGAIPAVAYVAIGRSYPEGLRSRIFAVLSTAWVVPGLVGPGVSALVADRLDWRWVFLGLLPLVMAAAALALPSLARIGPPPEPAAGPSRAPDALRVAVAVGLALGGLSSGGATAAALVAAGVVVGHRPLRRLLPAGTLRGRRGLPAATLCRGLLTFAFFGAEAFVPLAITSVREAGTGTAGLAITGATVAWTTGSWIQDRQASRWSGRRLVTLGLTLVLAGIATVAAALVPAVPLLVIVAGWTVAGLGMGIAYAPISMVVLGEAPLGQQGAATAAMQLADNLGVALGAGLGGAAVAYADAFDWPPWTGLGAAYAIAAAVGLVGLAVARRLPSRPLAIARATPSPPVPVAAPPAADPVLGQDAS